MIHVKEVIAIEVALEGQTNSTAVQCTVPFVIGRRSNRVKQLLLGTRAGAQAQRKPETPSELIDQAVATRRLRNQNESQHISTAEPRRFECHPIVCASSNGWGSVFTYFLGVGFGSGVKEGPGGVL